MKSTSESTLSNSGDETLNQLRQEIQAVDRKFATLLSRRQELAQQILLRKVQLKQPLRDFTVEQQVIERFAAFCHEQGIEARWGIDLANFLIGKSLEAQSNLLEQRRPGNRLRVLVVGGLGKMGSWMCSFLHNQGHSVQVFDPQPGACAFPRVAKLEAGVVGSQVVVVSVPLRTAPHVLTDVLMAQPTGVVFDICSLKKEVMPILQQAANQGLLVTSIHPLFGSGITTLHGRNIILCPCGQPEADALATSLFAETAANLMTLSPEQHDRLMTLTLGFSHTLNLLFARVLTVSGESFESLMKVASSTFARQVNTTLEVAGDNMELYFDIQRLSAYEELFQTLSQELGRLHRLVDSDERSAFMQSMGEVESYFRQQTEGISVDETE